MGKFLFENTIRVEFEDRLLAHLQHVITSKLRRDEPFLFTWAEDVSVGGGRTAVWLHSHANISYKFHGGRTPQLNPAWLRALNHTAMGPHGLYVVSEPDPQSTRGLRGAVQPMTFTVLDETSAVAPVTASA